MNTWYYRTSRFGPYFDQLAECLGSIVERNRIRVDGASECFKEISKIAVHPLTRPAPKNGPGTELQTLLESMGLKAKKGCSCKAMVRQMNRWGIEGCRENRAWIIARMKDNYKKYSTWEAIKAAVHAKRSGLLKQIKKMDPFGSLVDLAIERAAAGE